MLKWLWELMERRIEIHIVIGLADSPEIALPNGKHSVKCDACGWEGHYDNPQSARRGLVSHQNHCGKYVKQKYEWLDEGKQTIGDE